jgi:protein transport protein SEC61 subunit alpha
MRRLINFSVFCRDGLTVVVIDPLLTLYGEEEAIRGSQNSPCQRTAFQRGFEALRNAPSVTIQHYSPFSCFLLQISLSEKIAWTVACLGIYLVCSQMPLYGITTSKSSDPFYIMRMILASSRGSLMELGISPIITSGMIMQLLQGARIIDCDTSVAEDRKLYNAANKLLGILITLGEALAYVLSGMYGDVRDLGVVTAFLLIVQLTFAGLIVLTLDDLLSKGYGLGGGINLFIVTNICEGFFWRCFSPTTFNVGKGTEFEGAVVATIHGILFKSNKFKAIGDALFRENLPNLTNLMATILVFLVVIYIQGFKIDLPLVPKTGPRGGQRPTYPIKLFYTSNMPIILLSALVSQVYFFSQLLYKRYPANILIKLLGRWSEPSAENPNSRPVSSEMRNEMKTKIVFAFTRLLFHLFPSLCFFLFLSLQIGGLSYYISPPGSFTELVMDPFHGLFYITFMLALCGLFAKTWIEISGSAPLDVAKQLDEQGVYIQGFNTKQSMVKRLNQIIPTAAMFGGMCVAALSISADLLGAIGSGTGIMMAVTIIYDLYERFVKEAQEEMRTNPEARRMFGNLVKAKSA